MPFSLSCPSLVVFNSAVINREEYDLLDHGANEFVRGFKQIQVRLSMGKKSDILSTIYLCVFLLLI